MHIPELETESNLDLASIVALVESKETFPVDFDALWQWVGFSRKDHAKTCLLNNFERGLDFEIFAPANSGAKSEDGRGGHNRETIKTTLDCAKAFAMLAQTGTGRIVRRYFIDVEKRYKDIQHALPAPVEKPEPMAIGDTFQRMTIAEWVQQYGLRKPDFMLFANQVRSFSVALGQPPSYQVDCFGLGRAFTLDLLQYVWDEYQSERRRKFQERRKKNHRR